jgi:hypothetical protein
MEHALGLVLVEEAAADSALRTPAACHYLAATIQLTGLLGLVEDADAAPTTQAVRAVGELERAVEAARARVRAVEAVGRRLSAVSSVPPTQGVGP